MSDGRGEPADAPLEVVVVGSGVAGLETVMALRALAGGRVRVKVVTPESEFAYRPLAVGEPFDLGSPHRHSLAAIAADFDAVLVEGRLDWVAPGAQRIFTDAGEEIGYDALVLALGARPWPEWDHVLTFSGSRDADAVRSVVGEVESGEAGSVAFVVPSGRTWPLPIYELALLTARRAEAAGVRPQLAIYTPEREPLAIFGTEASRAVAAELDRAGVLVARASHATVTPDGDVVVPFEETPRRFDRVIALPNLRGPEPRGVPTDEHGFIPIDRHGVVRGLTHVYAAGDGTDYPIKHGGLAAEQADAIAEVIAKRAGAWVDPRPFREVIRGQLVTGADPQYLRADLETRGTELSEVSATPLWWPATKVAGARLGPYLAALEPAAEPEPEHPRIVVMPSYFENNPWGE
jgi:sulfide:quinone oxidoreductase